jgi:hypothetical protein
MLSIFFNASGHIWYGGEVPETDKEWEILSENGVVTVINFSNQTLPFRNGFEIINVSPNLESLTMPMTDSEHSQCTYFTRTLNFAKNVPTFYVCGSFQDRTTLGCILFANFNGINVQSDTSIDIVYNGIKSSMGGTTGNPGQEKSDLHNTLISVYTTGGPGASPRKKT